MHRIWQKLLKPRVLKLNDAQSFEQKWEIKTTFLQVISVFLLFIIMVSVLTTIFNRNMLDETGNKSNNKMLYLKQLKNMDSINNHILSNERYIQNLQKVLAGNLTLDSVYKISQPKIDVINVNAKITAEEYRLEEKVKDKFRTDLKTAENSNLTFVAPLQSLELSHQKQNGKWTSRIAARKGSSFRAIHSGIVIFSGFTSSDKYVIILQHEKGFISIYKNANALFKKVGDRITVGELIGLISEDEENPYLELEIWQNNVSISSEKIISF